MTTIVKPIPVIGMRVVWTGSRTFSGNGEIVDISASYLKVRFDNGTTNGGLFRSSLEFPTAETFHLGNRLFTEAEYLQLRREAFAKHFPQTA